MKLAFFSDFGKLNICSYAAIFETKTLTVKDVSQKDLADEELIIHPFASLCQVEINKRLGKLISLSSVSFANNLSSTDKKQFLFNFLIRSQDSLPFLWKPA